MMNSIALKNSQKGNYQISLLISIVLFIGIAGFGLMYFFEAQIFPIKEVHVKNEFDNVSSEVFKEQVSQCIKSGYFGLEVDCVENNLNKLSWVRSVSVRKIWPDTVSIDIQEHKPIAIWKDGRLLSSSGEIVTTKIDKIAENLPTFLGHATFSQNMIQDYLVLSKSINKFGLHIEVLETDSRGALKLELSNGVQLYFGNFDVQYKTIQIEMMFPKLFDEHMNNIKRIDYRYQNGFAVQWADSKKKTFPVSENEANAKERRING